MDRRRVLVSGGNGFLGGYLVERLSASHDVYAGSRRGSPLPGTSWLPLELTDDPSGLDAVRRLAPTHVVHNAALSKPDVCEDDPDAAHAVNVEGTRFLAKAVRDSCLRFVYCSTDLVFDGTRPRSSETDVPSPLMVYGRTKLSGEEAARAVLGERVVVARLALLYGKGRGRATGRTFTETTIDQARAGLRVPSFLDQYRSPLYVEDAAAGLEQILGWPEGPPFVHLGGPERISRFDMGVRTLEVFGLDPSGIVGVRMEVVPSRVPRPRDVSLDIGLAQSKGFEPRSVREGLLAMREVFRRE